MNLFKRMLITAPAAIAMTAFIGAHALDLPTKKINGSTCYYYKVGKSETVYGVAHKLGVSRDDIIKYNPAAADGLKDGQYLYFPVGDFKETTAAQEATIIEPDAERRLTPVKKDYEIRQLETPEAQEQENGSTDESDAIAQSDEEDSVAETVEARKYTVAVMLPFMLDEEKTSKATNQVTDFYKGFLIAADSIISPNEQIDILTYDTKGSLERVKHILSTDSRLKDASIIITPNNAEQFQAIANFASNAGTYVLNDFIVKDTSYRTNQYVLQSNVTSDNMYNRAVDAFVDVICSDSTTIPVILNNTTGKQDKQAFIEMLTLRLIEKGISPMSVQYTGNLSASTITDQIGEPNFGQQYAFISTSSALSDFNKYAPGLAKFKDTVYNNGGNVRLFGYPEWTTFKNDALEMMHKIDATIYSRFYADPNSREMRGIESAFKRWYGKSPADGVPSQAALGFDTGCYIFNALQHNYGDFSDNTNCSWQGAQTSFNFNRETGDNGQVNTSVYIVRFQPGSFTDTTVL